MTIHVDGTEVVTVNQLAAALGTTVAALSMRKTRGTIRLEPVAVVGGVHLYSKSDIARLRVSR